MNLRRRPLIAGGVALMAAPRIVFPQAKGKVWRIGVLLNDIAWDEMQWFPKYLGEFGQKEGRKVQFEVRSSHGQRERLDGLATELVKAKVDLIVAPLNWEILAAKRATSTIPIVMMYGVEPVETGFIASLARPGGNITGTTTNSSEFSGKMIEVIRDLLPGLARIALLTETDFPGMAAYQRTSERAAAVLGVKSVTLHVGTLQDLETAFKTLERDRPDAIFLSMTGAILSHQKRVIEFAARQRLPAVYSIDTPVYAGGLMSYSPDFYVLSRRNLQMIFQILRGAKPADIPVQEPARFKLTVNRKTAKALGLVIPPSFLARVNEVIQ